MVLRKKGSQKGAIDLLLILGIAVLVGILPLAKKVTEQRQTTGGRAAADPCSSDQKDTWRCNGSNREQCQCWGGSCGWGNSQSCSFGCENGSCKSQPCDGMCFYGNSSCELVGRFNGQGTCSGGICCGDPKKYSCNNSTGACSEDRNGFYTDLNNCQSVCSLIINPTPTTSVSGDQCSTPEDCAGSGRCDLTCSGSPRKCGWRDCNTPSVPTPACTVGDCCGCHTKYGNNCECDIPTDTCSNGCPTPTLRLCSEIAAGYGAWTCSSDTNTGGLSHSGCYENTCYKNIFNATSRDCPVYCRYYDRISCGSNVCIGGYDNGVCSCAAPTSIPPTAAPTPVCDFYNLNNCSAACWRDCTPSGSCFVCPTMPPVSIPTQIPTATSTPGCGDPCTASSQCATRCGNPSWQCRGGYCSLPPTSTPRPTATITIRPSVLTPTPLTTITPLTVVLSNCGNYVGYQFYANKCYHCEFPTQSNPPIVSNSLCAPTSTPRPPATTIPTAVPTLDNSYYCIGNVLYQRRIGEVETCEYGCDITKGGCKPRPADCGVFRHGAYRCSDTGHYEICENGAWLAPRSCPAGKICRNDLCQDPLPSPTATLTPTPVCSCCGLLTSCNGINYGRQSCSVLERCCTSCGNEPTPTVGVTVPAGAAGSESGQTTISPTPKPNNRGIHCEGSNLMDGNLLIESCNFGCNQNGTNGPQCNPIPNNLACGSQGEKRCSTDGYTVQACDYLNGILQWKNIDQCGEGGCSNGTCRLAYAVGTKICRGYYTVGTYSANGKWLDEDCPVDENGDRKSCNNGVCAGETPPAGLVYVPLGNYAYDSTSTQYGLVPNTGDAVAYHQTAVGTGAQAGFAPVGDTSLLTRQAQTLEQQAYAMDIRNRLQSGQSLTAEQADYISNQVINNYAGIWASGIGNAAYNYQANWASLNYTPGIASTRYSSGVSSSDYIPQVGYVGASNEVSLESFVRDSVTKYKEYKSRWKDNDWRIEEGAKKTAYLFATEALPEEERKALIEVRMAITNASSLDLLRTKQVITGKYGIPSEFNEGIQIDEPGMFLNDKYLSSQAQGRWTRELIIEKLNKIGVSVLPPSAVGRESAVSAGGSYNTTTKTIDADWDPAIPGWNLPTLIHEAVHAFQFERYPNMPLAQKEFESYISTLRFTLNIRTGQLDTNKESLIRGIDYSSLYPVISRY